MPTNEIGDYLGFCFLSMIHSAGVPPSFGTPNFVAQRLILIPQLPGRQFLKTAVIAPN